MMGIAKNHGGFFTVSSKEGEGSQFTVYLPTIEAAPLREAEATERLQGQGELVFIVDDEAAIRESAKTLLEDCNYRTLTANDGASAIQLYAEHQAAIAVVLMDLMMPGIDGVTTIQALQIINPTLKVIATSGLISTRRLTELEQAGITTLLPKPYTLTELLQVLHNVLRSGPSIPR
ncbi:MAG: response regulator [Leptolyngbyaceae cyanobacterium SU_3_3]|nr:response regulator [Leptolyngbyaceae cyanobacterium SU_3_3]